MNTGVNRGDIARLTKVLKRSFESGPMFVPHPTGLLKNLRCRTSLACHSGEGRNPVLSSNKLRLDPDLRRGDISVALLRKTAFSTLPNGWVEKYRIQSSRARRASRSRFESPCDKRDCDVVPQRPGLLAMTNLSNFNKPRWVGYRDLDCEIAIISTQRRRLPDRIQQLRLIRHRNLPPLDTQIFDIAGVLAKARDRHRLKFNEVRAKRRVNSWSRMLRD